MMSQFKLFRRSDSKSVAVIEISNPPVNLVDIEFMNDLNGLLDDLESGDLVRVVVFRSFLPGYFVNHYDLSGRSVPKPDAPSYSGLLARLSRVPQITIGEIRGRTRGAGSEFALALDMRFASREHAVFGQPEVGVGLHPGAGGTQRLPTLMGRGRALEVMLSGEDYSAVLAEQYGWVNRTLPDRELSEFVDTLAARIAGFPTAGTQNIKALVNRSFLPTDEILSDEFQEFRRAMKSPEFVDRLKWLFSRGAQTSGEVELDMGAMLAKYPALPSGGG
jgi:enoyl-CoA hydratase/carnithine racemase